MGDSTSSGLRAGGMARGLQGLDAAIIRQAEQPRIPAEVLAGLRLVQESPEFANVLAGYYPEHRSWFLETASQIQRRRQTEADDKAEERTAQWLAKEQGDTSLLAQRAMRNPLIREMFMGMLGPGGVLDVTRPGPPVEGPGVVPPATLTGRPGMLRQGPAMGPGAPVPGPPMVEQGALRQMSDAAVAALMQRQYEAKQEAAGVTKFEREQHLQTQGESAALHRGKAIAGIQVSPEFAKIRMTKREKREAAAWANVDTITLALASDPNTTPEVVEAARLKARTLLGDYLNSGSIGDKALKKRYKSDPSGVIDTLLEQRQKQVEAEVTRRGAVGVQGEQKAARDALAYARRMAVQDVGRADRELARARKVLAEAPGTPGAQVAVQAAQEAANDATARRDVLGKEGDRPGQLGLPPGVEAALTPEARKAFEAVPPEQRSAAILAIMERFAAWR